MSGGGSRYGAGRPRSSIKAEDCRKLDVREWHRAGALDSGEEGTWHWQDRKATRYSVESDALVLRHDLAGRPIMQRLPILRTPCHYGGVRIWLGCPTCMRRVAVLYLRPAGFLCRKCAHVAYASQGEDAMDRAWRAQRKIERRLGGDHRRPDGMRAATYSRLLLRIVHCEQRRHEALAAWLRPARARG